MFRFSRGFPPKLSAIGLLVALVSAANAGSDTVLYSFQGGSDGAGPVGGVVSDAAGNLYGLTYAGGTGCIGGCGTVYRLAPDGTETVLYAFLGGADGAVPTGNLILDQGGNLFGTTEQ